MSETANTEKSFLQEIHGVRLDTVTLERIAALYPEPLREPLLWLGTFIREECGRDVDVLVDRAQKLEIRFDKTSWAKLLRGRWNRDADGELLPSPTIALPRLLRAIETLRRDAQLKAQAGKVPFVMTPTAQLMWNAIDSVRAEDRVNKFLVIIGETGTQKTATFKQYRMLNNHGTVIWLEAPASPSMRQFVTDLAECYGCSRSMGWDRKLNHIRNAVNEKKCIVVDNIQRLYDDRREGDQRVFHFLQKLQDDTGCSVVMSFTPVFYAKFTTGMARGFFEQFEGRAGGRDNFIRLPDYPTDEDVLAIAEAFKLQHADKAETVEYLVGLARKPGRVRVLFEALQRAAVRAKLRKQAMTINHVRAVRGED